MGLLEALSKRMGVRLIATLILLAPGIGIGWGWLLEMDFSMPQLMLPLTDLSARGALNAAIEALPTAPWLALIGSTIWLTALAAAVAIGGPPLGLLLWPGRTGVLLQRVSWGLMRLFPPPLTALLLLLLAKHNHFVEDVVLSLVLILVKLDHFVLLLKLTVFFLTFLIARKSVSRNHRTSQSSQAQIRLDGFS